MTVIADVITVDRYGKIVKLRGPRETIELHVQDARAHRKRSKRGDPVRAVLTRHSRYRCSWQRKSNGETLPNVQNLNVTLTLGPLKRSVCTS